MMTLKQRIESVYRGETPDVIPFMLILQRCMGNIKIQK